MKLQQYLIRKNKNKYLESKYLVCFYTPNISDEITLDLKIAKSNFLFLNNYLYIKFDYSNILKTKNLIVALQKQHNLILIFFKFNDCFLNVSKLFEYLNLNNYADTKEILIFLNKQHLKNILNVKILLFYGRLIALKKLLKINL